MNRRERDRRISAECEWYKGKLELSGDWGAFLWACARAFVGAGGTMGRDPWELAKEMGDGRLGHLIQNGAQGLPLPFHDADPLGAVGDELRARADIVAEEREAIEGMFKRILHDWDCHERDLRSRAYREGRARTETDRAGGGETGCGWPYKENSSE